MAAALNILVLCTGNSARSIIGEALINDLGGGKLRAFSAGSHPVGRVNPGAIEVLESRGHAVDGLASKSWNRFSGDDAAAVDIVITVCDNAAGETCPVWPGSPVTVHWGIPDPASDGDFAGAYRRLRQRVEAMLALPFERLSTARLKADLESIHESGRGSAGQE